ncbi:MAG: response regulator transcription factor [Deltaproteobacteria bacterium]|nr:response regulator transcription factor [Deltaproteobacteria bacterium]
MSALILIVEDEEDMVAILEYNLQREGYQTRTALTGAKGLELAAEEPLPDLVLLDIMLPDISGTEICRRIREDARTRSIPIIMTTAKGEEIDRVVGFEVGADDYVVKPFSIRELLLRIRAILRRGRPEESAEDVMTFGRLKVDEQGHRTWVDDKELMLTAMEFRLLTTLLKRKGRVQTRDQLLDGVWGIQAEVTTRTVDTHVKRLRQKLGAAGAYIETIRGVGYRFQDKAVEESA